MTTHASNKKLLSRRDVLTACASGMAVAAAGTALASRPAGATPQEATALAQKLTGTSDFKDGRVSMKLPQIAENGNTVPVTVTVDSPMTDGDYCKAIHILAEDNPTPSVASFNLTPDAGKAEVSCRMRLAKTQNVVAVAQMSDGSTHMAKQEIKVTIGGCGG